MDVSHILTCLDYKKSWSPDSFVVPLFSTPSSSESVDIDLLEFLNERPSVEDKFGTGVSSVSSICSSFRIFE